MEKKTNSKAKKVVPKKIQKMASPFLTSALSSLEPKPPISELLTNENEKPNTNLLKAANDLVQPDLKEVVDAELLKTNLVPKNSDNATAEADEAVQEGEEKNIIEKELPSSQIKDEEQSNTSEKELIERKNKVKKHNLADFESFLKSTKHIRKTKAAYLSEDVHKKINHVLKYIGRDINIVDYIENVLQMHFQQYGEEIKRRIKEEKEMEAKNPDLF